jgi:hypothetical protein
MEFLIPGLLLVAFMVWASTKIKRKSAEAFAAELIETKYFRLKKTQGFLNVLGPDGGLILDIYSRSFITSGKKDFRAATIQARLLEPSDYESRLNSFKSPDAKITRYIECGYPAVEIENKTSEGGREQVLLAKLAIVQDSLLEFTVRYFVEADDETIAGAQQIFDSFQFKC